MTSISNLLRKPRLVLLLVSVAILTGLATAVADRPLSKDDVTLLLMGSSSDKIIQQVQQRGVGFQMTPELAKKFHDQGASDDLIEALQKAGNRTTTAAPNVSTTTPPPADAKPNAPDAPQPAAQAKPNSPEALVLAAKAQTSPPAAPPTRSAPVAPPPSNEPVMRQRQASSGDEPVLHVAGNATPAPIRRRQPLLPRPSRRPRSRKRPRLRRPMSPPAPPV